MKSYNGFSSSFRSKVAELLRLAIKEGRIQAPTFCSICGQDKGSFHYHLEDYTKPFENLYPVCISCHMKLHLRFSYPNIWKKHLHDIRAGKKSPPMQSVNDFFKKMKLAGINKDIDFVPMVENPTTWYEKLSLKPINL